MQLRKKLMRHISCIPAQILAVKAFTTFTQEGLTQLHRCWLSNSTWQKWNPSELWTVAFNEQHCSQSNYWKYATHPVLLYSARTCDFPNWMFFGKFTKWSLHADKNAIQQLFSIQQLTEEEVQEGLCLVFTPLYCFYDFTCWHSQSVFFCSRIACSGVSRTGEHENWTRLHSGRPCLRFTTQSTEKQYGCSVCNFAS